MSLLSGLTLAQESNPCKELTDKADKVIEAQKKAIELRDLRIRETKEELANTTKERDELQESRGKWYNSPLFYILIGAAAGALVVK